MNQLILKIKELKLKSQENRIEIAGNSSQRVRAMLSYHGCGDNLIGSAGDGSVQDRAHCPPVVELLAE